jgi:hypothetical protein
MWDGEGMDMVCPEFYTHVKPVVLTVASFSDTTWIREQLLE